VKTLIFAVIIALLEACMHAKTQKLRITAAVPKHPGTPSFIRRHPHGQAAYELVREPSLRGIDRSSNVYFPRYGPAFSN